MHITLKMAQHDRFSLRPVLYPKVCRTCLCEGELKDIFEVPHVPDMLFTFTSIRVSPADSLPRNICTACVDELTRIYAFSKRSEEVQEILRIVSAEYSSKIEIEEEGVRDEKPLPFLHVASGILQNREVQEIPQIVSAEYDDKINIEEDEKTLPFLHPCDVASDFYRNGEVQIVSAECDDKIDIEDDEKTLPFLHPCDVASDFHRNGEVQIVSAECDDKIDIEEDEKPLSFLHPCDDASDILQDSIGNEKPLDSPYNVKKYGNVYKNLKPHRWGRFKDSGDLMKHRASRDEEHLCADCGKAFTELSLLNEHKNTHSVKPHQCSDCGEGFYDSTTHESHVAQHKNETDRSPTCEICKKVLDTKYALKMHLRQHSGVMCPHCDKFFLMRNYRQHLRCHSGEKPFLCSFCGQTFAQRSDMKIHELRHIGLKPHECSYCGKRFLLKSELREHEQRHKLTPPYNCSHCEKSYAFPGKLKLHLRRCHTGEKLKNSTGSDVDDSGGLNG